MHNLRKNFDRILAIVKSLLKHKVDEHGNLKKVGPRAKFSDLEVITLSLLADSLLIDSENYLFKLLQGAHRDAFPNLIDRSNYNRRRRALTPLIEAVRQALIQNLVPYEDTFVLDSMPLEICQFARAKRIKICHESVDTAPAFGYCAVHSRHYYGYKIHGVCTMNGVITSFDLAPANVADIHDLQDIKHQYSGCLLLGDKGYLSAPLQTKLFQKNRLLLKTPMRWNQTNFMKQPAVFRKVRKQIETIFSQWCDHFLIRRNYAKTFKGLAPESCPKSRLSPCYNM